MSKVCTKCDTLKPLTEYYLHSSKTRLMAHCKVCNKKQSSEWQRKNREAACKHTSKSKKKNRGPVNAAMAKRRAAQLQRTPSWANQEEIKMVYKQAASLQKLLGMKLHVDHVVPLQGRTVSGLHVPYNLQITTAAHNLSKSKLEEHLNV